jgi:ferredoxin-NADP reductase
LSSWTKATVAAIADVTPSIREILLTPAGGAKDFTPGSHINVRIHVGAQAEERSYSLVGLPRDGHYRIAVKRQPDGRGGSLSMHGLAPGDTVDVSGPHNNFPISFGRPDYLLIAGGVGITPIVGMALALKRSGARFRLVHAVRETAELAFRDELDAVLGNTWQRAVSAEGNRLNLTAALSGVAPDGEVYICGPVSLLADARREWSRMNRSPELFRFESFASSGHFPTLPFRVELPHLGIHVDVGANETMLDAMRRANVGMMSSCQRGECGLCAVSVLAASGVIDHRDVFLSESEKAKGTRMCACVSRAVGGTIAIDNGYQEIHPLL